MNLDAQKDATSRAARTVADTTTTAGTKVLEYGSTVSGTAGDAAKTFYESGKGFADKSVTSVKEYQVGDKNLAEHGASVTGAAKSFYESGRGFAGKSVTSVKEYPIGDKNVAERTQATVVTVQDKIDVDQIQDQVAKLRHQMEGVLGTWKDSFSPSTTVIEEETASVKKTPVKKTAVKKTAAKKTPAKKTPVKKTAAKRTPAKKTAAKK